MDKGGAKAERGTPAPRGVVYTSFTAATIIIAIPTGIKIYLTSKLATYETKVYKDKRMLVELSG